VSDQVRKYRPGTIVFREGESGDYACLVKTGEIELLKLATPNVPPFATLPPGHMFGELALLDGSPRMATARAGAKETEIVIVDRVRFQAKIKNLTPTHRELFEFFAGFIRETPIWVKPNFDQAPPELDARAKRIATLIPAIENSDRMKTGDAFIDVMVKMLVHYAKRRLPASG
jgi:CRP/FNR family transcriptional regulator, cyclic AMP receptor protein